MARVYVSQLTSALNYQTKNDLQGSQVIASRETETVTTQVEVKVPAARVKASSSAFVYPGRGGG